MKISLFHLTPYRWLPDDFPEKYRSVWVDISGKLWDSRRGHHLYNECLDELEFAEKMGMDGIWEKVAQKAVEPNHLIPPAYADAFNNLMTGARSVRIEKIRDAGHMVLLERTDTAVKAATRFCSE